MTNEEIKQAIKDQGYTIKAFAQKIEVAYGTLLQALNGHQNLTPALKNHIMLALSSAAGAVNESPGRDVFMVFKVKVPGGDVVEEIGGTIGARGVTDRRAALAGIVRHNVGELIKLGASLSDIELEPIKESLEGALSREVKVSVTKGD